MSKPAAFLILLPGLLWGQKFLSDDPLEREPAPEPVTKAQKNQIGEYYDFFRATFGKPGERHTPGRVIPSRNVNTLGEVMDGAWYVNRHYRKRMSIPELLRGPGNDAPPSKQGPWQVTGAKTEGVTPGFTIKDASGRRYLIKFDPLANLELSTAAEVIGSKFFHALGYHVPESYIVYFDRNQLEIGPDVTVKEKGRVRPMRKRDLEEALFAVPRDPKKGYRAVAGGFIKGGLGPFLYEGTRTDDPNDLVPHEHRRELRGLFVFAAWLGHNDIKCLNTLDAITSDGGISHIRHHLIDFGASLGSDSFTTKSPRAGYEYLFGWRPAAAQFFSLGLYVPEWARAHNPRFSSVGNFEYEVFEPEEWKPNYPAAIFDNRLPEDTFWAARQVMWFTEAEIRAIVETGQYGNAKAAEWLIKCLVERRNKIGRTYLEKVLPLDRFRVEGERLAFDDLGVTYGFASRRQYSVRWSRFHNDTQAHTPIEGANGLDLPAGIRQSPNGSYFAARITAGDESKSVIVFLRKQGDTATIVGIDRTS
ncbi:MAG: hypothetical protein ACKV22_07575 [Bryobacteraceae bacterium]